MLTSPIPTTSATLPGAATTPVPAPAPVPTPQPQPINAPGAVQNPQASPQVAPQENTASGADTNAQLPIGILWYAVSAFAYASMFAKTQENIQAFPDGNGLFMFEKDNTNIPVQVNADVATETEKVKTSGSSKNSNKQSIINFVRENPGLLKENPNLLVELGLEEVPEPEDLEL